MPNGGSDCCGTCWYNERNQGEAGYESANEDIPARCRIRDFPIQSPFWTYCANHPHRCPDGDPIPIGPVYIGEFREIFLKSPDNETTREHILALLAEIREEPEGEYPAGFRRDEIVVWQAGEFGDPRAIPLLERILRFDPDDPVSESAEPSLLRTTKRLQAFAEEALRKMTGNGN